MSGKRRLLAAGWTFGLVAACSSPVWTPRILPSPAVKTVNGRAKMLTPSAPAAAQASFWPIRIA